MILQNPKPLQGDLQAINENFVFHDDTDKNLDESLTFSNGDQLKKSTFKN